MIPLLAYAPSTNNQRVRSMAVPGDETARIFSSDASQSLGTKQDIIQAAYLQIFHEQQMLQCFRMTCLESQLKNNQVTVREFIRGLLTSDNFRRLNYDSNDNYRFVELCIQRVLGRNVYHDQEKLSWSIILATRGLVGFVDMLLNSDEYLENFGLNTVPYHRQRVVPQRSQGELPFARMARYGAAHRATLPSPRMLSVADNNIKAYKRILAIPVLSGVLLILVVFGTVVVQ